MKPLNWNRNWISRCPSAHAAGWMTTLFADELTEEKKKVVLDNINLLYVAFTRAVDHLHIICRKQKEKKNNGPDDDLSNYELLRDIAVPIMDSQRELAETIHWENESVKRKQHRKRLKRKTRGFRNLSPPSGIKKSPFAVKPRSSGVSTTVIPGQAQFGEYWFIMYFPPFRPSKTFPQP